MRARVVKIDFLQLRDIACPFQEMIEEGNFEIRTEKLTGLLAEVRGARIRSRETSRTW